MYYLAIGMPGIVGNYWLMVFFFPVLSLLLALSLPMFERIPSLKIKLLDKFVTHTSKISYSLYLGHICMLTLVNSVIGMLGIDIKSQLQTFIVYAVYGIAYYSFATITYTFIEKPYLDLRDSK